MFIELKNSIFLKSLIVIFISLLAVTTAKAQADVEIDDYPTTIRGTLNSGNIADWIVIEGLQDQYLEIKLSRTSGDLDPKVWLLDENEEVLAVNDDYAGTINSRILFRLPYTGDYTVVVGGSAGNDLATSGNYELSLRLVPGFTSSFGVGTNIYLSSSTGGEAGSIVYRDEDILVYDVDAQVWSMYFDGSDVGLDETNVDIDAFAVISDVFDDWEDDRLLISLNREVVLPDVGRVDDSDVLLFIPTRLGSSTAGQFFWIFDGSDLGLNSSNEDIDAISLTQVDNDIWLVFSTSGEFNAGGVSGQGQDLLLFDPSEVGEDSQGRLKLYFDGSDVGLSSNTENIDGLTIDSSFRSGDINYITTNGDYSISTQSGDGNAVFTCDPESLNTRTRCKFKTNKEWDGTLSGLTRGHIDGLHVEKPDV